MAEHGRGRRRRPKPTPVERLRDRPLLAGAAGVGVVVCGAAAFALLPGDDAPSRAAAPPRAEPSPDPTFGEEVPPKQGGAADLKPTASASANPSRSASPKPSSGPAGLSASYSTGNTWGSGFIGTLTVVNRGTAPVPAWQLSASFSGRTITTSWTPSGSVRNSHAGDRVGGTGGSLGPGDSVQISFQADGRPGAPTSCTLNGRPC